MTPEERRAALVERVADEIRDSKQPTFERIASDVIDLLTPLIRAEALREAVKTAEEWRVDPYCVAAIRALISKEAPNVVGR